jgi:hypothetical protein
MMDGVAAWIALNSPGGLDSEISVAVVPVIGNPEAVEGVGVGRWFPVPVVDDACTCIVVDATPRDEQPTPKIASAAPIGKAMDRFHDCGAPSATFIGTNLRPTNRSVPEWQIATGRLPSVVVHRTIVVGYPNPDHAADDLAVCKPSVLWLVRSLGPT